MTAKRLKFLLNWFWVYSKKSKTAGFTLIELLVAIIIASLIIVVLLSLVIEILQIDHREAARDETQQEMQRASDFISKELREAVYVYDGNCLQNTAQGNPQDANYCPGLANYLPTFANQTPVIAFWKPEIIPDDQMPTNCSAFATDALKQECNDLLIRRRTYELVVYLQSTENSSNIWSGKSRITRYTLHKYKDTSNLILSEGYVDPSKDGGTIFQTWPLQINATANTTTNLQATSPLATNTPDVLVDFVDAPNATGVTVPPCDSTRNYVPSPKATVTTASSNSFFACVRSAVPTTTVLATTPTGLNQDAILYLRGNANGKPGVTSNNFRPVLQTQILMRGVINKVPQ